MLLSLPHLPPGAVIADTSTIEPAQARRFADQADAAGVAYLDAPVSGGPAGAACGQLAMMVGGPAVALQRVRPSLLPWATRIMHGGVRRGAGGEARQ